MQIGNKGRQIQHNKGISWYIWWQGFFTSLLRPFYGMTQMYLLRWWNRWQNCKFLILFFMSTSFVIIQICMPSKKYLKTGKLYFRSMWGDFFLSCYHKYLVSGGHDIFSCYHELVSCGHKLVYGGQKLLPQEINLLSQIPLIIHL